MATIYITLARMPRTRLHLFTAAAAILFSTTLPARIPQPAGGPSSTDAGFFKELRWRTIGPFRGGRMKAAAGVPQ